MSVSVIVKAVCLKRVRCDNGGFVPGYDTLIPAIPAMDVLWSDCPKNGSYFIMHISLPLIPDPSP
ncbi:MAG: hypothetical protein Q7W05_12115 [Deltaproteobacteria bacterium]|jgi:hypothetical protein|nr:hypothetical protein [Deltaproteobacteria bacterium]